MEKELKAMQEERGRKNAKLARHRNVSIRTGWTHTAGGEIFLRDGQGRKKK